MFLVSSLLKTLGVSWFLCTVGLLLLRCLGLWSCVDFLYAWIFFCFIYFFLEIDARDPI